MTPQNESSDVEAKDPLRWKNEDHWQAITFAAAAISFAILSIVSVFWVFRGADQEEILKRVQILAPFALFAGASVTFCTVVWRGLISARQVNLQLEATNLQRQQIDKLADQIAATEENNLATLLQKGAELLAQENPAQNAAGISTLGSVAVAPNTKFAKQALNLIADFIQQNFHESKQLNNCQAAIAELGAAESIGRASNRHLRFSCEPVEFMSHSPNLNAIQSTEILGVQSVTIDNADSLTVPIEHLHASKTPYRFVNASISGGEFAFELYLRNDFHDMRNNFRNCTFDSCRIVVWDPLHVDCSFSNCNFSDCKIRSPDDFPDLRHHGNFYVVDNPPKSTIDFDWQTVLLKGRPNLKFAALEDPKPRRFRKDMKSK